MDENVIGEELRCVFHADVMHSISLIWTTLDYMPKANTLCPELIHKRCDVVPSGCWEWNAFKHPQGYGRIWISGKLWLAHRASYVVFRNPDIKGVLDHLCRNPSCVNPEHLEDVSQRENVMRGDGMAAKRAATTHCPYGHPYSGENLIVTGNGARRCRVCTAYKTHIAYLKSISANPPTKCRNRVIFGKEQFLAIARQKAMKVSGPIAGSVVDPLVTVTGEDHISDLDLLNRYAAAKGPYQ